MKLLLTRASVCAADDIDPPHELRQEIDTDKVDEALLWIARSGYLPKIADARTSWSAVSNLPVAVFAQKWDAPRLLIGEPHWLYQKRFKYEGDFWKIHFNHHNQVDPETVVQVLRNYSPG